MKSRTEINEKENLEMKTDKPIRARSIEELESVVGTEIADKRTMNAKTFAVGDNMFQSVLYAEPVHYYDATKKTWEEIDNTLVEETNSLGEKRLINRKNGCMCVAMGTGSKMVEITNEEGDTISWGIEGARPKALAAGRKQSKRTMVNEPKAFNAEVQERIAQDAVYDSIKPGVQMRCHLGSTSFKEDIIFESLDKAKDVAFLINAPGLSLELHANDSITVRNAKQREAFTMPAPFMVDSAGEIGSVSVSLVKKNANSWRMAYALDADWLQTAAFPVTLDPAIHMAKYREMGIADSKEPKKAYANSHDFQLINLIGHKCTCFLRFTNNVLPQLDTSYAVTSAILHLPLNIPNNSGKNAGPLYLREVLSDWSSQSLTYETQPTLSEDDVDCANPTAVASMDYQFNIATLVERWHKGVNYGVAIDAREIDTHLTIPYNSFPYVVITYASQAGLEKYYTYESHSVGRAGTAHVNLFNGNLVFEHADTSCNGNKMPVSLSHYYNACYRHTDSFSAGYGWKHSMHNTWYQSTYAKAMDASGSVKHEKCYEYTDADGTQHTFIPATKADTHGNDATYEDLSGLSLRSSIYQIFDKNDNCMVFKTPNLSSGSLLQSIKDANGITVTLATSEKTVGTKTYPFVDSITDGAGRKTTLTSNDKGYVESIKAPGFEETGIAFEYDDKGCLTKITYEDELFTVFTYDDLNLLTSVTNHDGRTLTIEYESFSPYRVKKICETNGEVVGNCREYTYDHLTTTVTDRTIPGGKQLFYTFNTYGNLIETHDMLGQAVVAKFTEQEPMNHPKSVSKMMRAVVNLLRNHNFEKGIVWKLAGPARYDSQNQMSGDRCMCFNSGLEGKAMQISQTLNLMPGQPYVFSFYAKCCGMMSLTCAMEYQDAEGVKHMVESPVLSDGPLYTYERLFHTFTLPAGSDRSVTLFIRGKGEAGSVARAWIDCAQLEEGVLPNRYNMLINGDFSHDCAGRPFDWKANEDTTQEDTAIIPDDVLGKPSGLTSHVLKLHGAAGKKGGYYQEIKLPGQTGDVFLIGGWANGFSAKLDKEFKRKFGLHIAFKNEDGEYVDADPIQWEGQHTGWQFTCGATIAKENYTSLRLYIDYANNINAAEFDGLFLHREHFGNSFAYDDKGNVISAENLTGKKSEAEYDKFDNLIKYRGAGHPKSEVVLCDYGATDVERKKHLLLKQTSPSKMSTQYTYDTAGNVLTTMLTGPDTTDFIKSTVKYAEGDNYVSEQTDARGMIAKQDIDPVLGTTKTATNPDGQVIEHTYDDLRRLTETKTAADGKTYRNTYTYENRKLMSMAHNTGSDDDCDVVYNFTYDALGNRTTVSIGDQLLSKSVYSDTGDKLLKRMEYANGSTIHYGYDDYKRVVNIRYDDEATPRYSYDFDASGNVGRMVDANLGVTTTYETDLASRPSRMREFVGDVHQLTLETEYDSMSRVTRTREFIGPDKTPFEAEFAYDSESRPTSISYGVPEQGVEIRYDSLGRVISKKVLNEAEGYLTNYAYAQGGQGVGSTTGLVQEIEQPGESFAYTYDALGNIMCESRNGIETTYVYDKLSQLVRVNDPHAGKTTTYAYDRGCNLLMRKEYAYTKGDLPETAEVEVPYLYEDENWKDKLTKYNGKEITYDAAGNPLDDGTWKYTWRLGRQLAKMERSGTGESVKFTYNAAGLRVQKESGNTKTKYTLAGTNVIHMVIEKSGDAAETREMHFWYGAGNGPVACLYQGKRYGYVYNVQGDVVAIVNLDNFCEQVVTYTYDAWGKQTGCSGVMADTLGKDNPFRYRGYLFDEETRLYYLRTRYYDPGMGRFLNSDSLLVKNLFAYCGNCPVVCADHSGNLSQAAKDLINNISYAGGYSPSNYDQISQQVSYIMKEDRKSGSGSSVDMSSSIHYGSVLNDSTNSTSSSSKSMLPVIYGMPEKQRNNLLAGWVAAGIITVEQLRRIQYAANLTEQRIDLIGSRAAGTATEISDWDYIMYGKSSKRHLASSLVPRGTSGGGNDSGRDIFNGNTTPLDESLPHIIFEPNAVPRAGGGGKSGGSSGGRSF